jgi:hypothetical protein
VDLFARCPGCGHVLAMHNPGGCYGDNLECACPFDRAGVADALLQAAGKVGDHQRTVQEKLVRAG